MNNLTYYSIEYIITNILFQKGVLKINSKSKSPIEKNIVWGMLFIAILSTLMHFLYNISGKLILTALISPINESVWEHLKLSLLPTFIWWICSYFYLKKNNDIILKKWIFSAIISFLICIIFITVFYYTYTGAFGIHSLVLDVLGLLIGIVLGQNYAYKTYQYADIKPIHYIIIFCLFSVLLILFVIFTFNPPHIPIFKDGITGKYGLKG